MKCGEHENRLHVTGTLGLQVAIYYSIFILTGSLSADTDIQMLHHVLCPVSPVEGQSTLSLGREMVTPSPLHLTS